jgi:hypothetical protein
MVFCAIIKEHVDWHISCEHAGFPLFHPRETKFETIESLHGEKTKNFRMVVKCVHRGIYVFFTWGSAKGGVF